MATVIPVRSLLPRTVRNASRKVSKNFITRKLTNNQEAK
jgi:hypothetical protein